MSEYTESIEGHDKLRAGMTAVSAGYLTRTRTIHRLKHDGRAYCGVAVRPLGFGFIGDKELDARSCKRCKIRCRP